MAIGNPQTFAGLGQGLGQFSRLLFGLQGQRDAEDRLQAELARERAMRQEDVAFRNRRLGLQESNAQFERAQAQRDLERQGFVQPEFREVAPTPSFSQELDVQLPGIGLAAGTEPQGPFSEAMGDVLGPAPSFDVPELTLTQGGYDPSQDQELQRALAIEGATATTRDPVNWQTIETEQGYVQVNPETGQQRSLGLRGPQPAPEPVVPPVERGESLRKEFVGRPVIQDAATVAQSYQRVLQAAETPSAAGDLSLIFNYMKILDPGSVVRESEFANAAATGSYGERVQGYVQRVLRGERLSDTVRQDFVQSARELVQGQQQMVQRIADQYRGFARQIGVDPSNVVFDPFAGVLEPQATGPEAPTATSDAGPGEEALRALIRDALGNR